MKKEILECGHVESEHGEFTRGYGTDSEGNRFCFDCCTDQDKKQMMDTGKIALYLVSIPEDELPVIRGGMSYDSRVIAHITNWPGMISIPIYGISKGRHNWAYVRYDVWFTFAGEEWHGTQYGNDTQLCHCKRLKAK